MALLARLALVLVGLGCSLEPALVPASWVPAAERTGPLAIDSAPPPVAAPVPHAIRVATFNIAFGEEPVRWAERLASRAELAAVDLWLLQEIEAHPGEGESRARALARELGLGFVYAPARPSGDGTHGLAILSRFPLGDVRVMDLPHFETSLRDRPRIALAARIDLGHPVDVVNVHLDLPLSLAERLVQLYPATQDLMPSALLGGDLNSNPYDWIDSAPIVVTDAISDIDAAELIDDWLAGEGFVAATKDAGPTHHTPVSELRLDSLYVRGLRPDNAGVARDVSGSDHWPLWIDIEGADLGLRAGVD